MKAISTESSQSLTPSSDSTGIVLIWTGARWKSLKTKTKSKFLRPNYRGNRSVSFGKGLFIYINILLEVGSLPELFLNVPLQSR